MTVPRALLLVLALLQAGGVLEVVVRRATCEEQCKRDGCDGDCTPGNDASQCSCHCPSSPTLTAPNITMALNAPIGQPAELTIDRTGDRLHSNPDPREIQHVPRRAI